MLRLGRVPVRLAPLQLRAAGSQVRGARVGVRVCACLCASKCVIYASANWASFVMVNCAIREKHTNTGRQRSLGLLKYLFQVERLFCTFISPRFGRLPRAQCNHSLRVSVYESDFPGRGGGVTQPIFSSEFDTDVEPRALQAWPSCLLCACALSGCFCFLQNK